MLWYLRWFNNHHDVYGVHVSTWYYQDSWRNIVAERTTLWCLMVLLMFWDVIIIIIVFIIINNIIFKGWASYWYGILKHMPRGEVVAGCCEFGFLVLNEGINLFKSDLELELSLYLSDIYLCGEHCCKGSCGRWVIVG